jgi:two-component sensor histidine kinase
MDELQPFRALGLAREREPSPKAADWRVQELNHRLVNSLQLAVDLLGLQHQRSEDAGARQGLEDAMARLVAVGQLHRHLATREPQELVELSAFLRGLCPAIGLGTGLACELAADPVNVPAEMAQNIGLLINECALNARKHAYGRDGGVLRIECITAPGRLTLSVADEGSVKGSAWASSRPSCGSWAAAWASRATAGRGSPS